MTSTTPVTPAQRARAAGTDPRGAVPQPAPGPTRAPTEVKSAARTVELLEMLAAERQPLTLSEIAGRLELPVSSVHQLLRTLVSRGWLATSGTTYSVGVRALLTGMSFIERDPVVQAVKPVLGSLRSELGETVHLAQLDGDRVVYLLSRESEHQLRTVSRVGQSLPAHATALGKAALSTLADAEVCARLPDRLLALTARTITSPDVLLADLQRSRERGWAQEAEESSPGTGCIAVPIPTDAPAIYAMSCSLPLSRATPERVEAVAAALRAGARAAATALGTAAR